MAKLKVREVAEARGINKSQLSRRADLAQTTINEIWDGTRQDVRVSTLEAIARVLGVKVADLIEEVGENQNGSLAENQIEPPALAA